MLTCIRVTKLSADYCGIRYSPAIITYCAPLVVVTEFHSSFKICCSSHQSDVSLITTYTRIGTAELISVTIT